MTSSKESDNASSSRLRFVLADYGDAAQADALVSLLERYALDPMGGAEPLPAGVRENLPGMLAATAGAFSLLGYEDEVPIALANCFVTLSTFACRPLINVHDLFVSSSHQGHGVGKALLAAIEAEARARGACKITLEVLEGNAVARAAYAKAGFRPYVLDESLGTALFLQRVLE